MHYHNGAEDLVTTFGLLFVLALGTWWWLARRNAKNVGIDPSHIDLLLPFAIVGGIAGGMLLSLLMPDDRQLAGEVLQVDSRIRFFGSDSPENHGLVTGLTSWRSEKSARAIQDALRPNRFRCTRHGSKNWVVIGL